MYWLTEEELQTVRSGMLHSGADVEELESPYEYAVEYAYEIG